jgi:hypothetical protein
MRAVAALCATIITKHDPATGTSSSTSRHSHRAAQMRQAAGYRPNDGDTRAAKFQAALAAIAPATAISGPGFSARTGEK